MLFKKENEYASYLMATVVAAMIVVVGLATNEIIFVIASMIIAPVLTNIRYPLGEEKKYMMRSEMRTRVEKALYFLRFAEDSYRLFITIFMIILLSWIFGFIASSLNWSEVSVYFATNN